jgi:hypothetical protein
VKACWLKGRRTNATGWPPAASSSRRY